MLGPITLALLWGLFRTSGGVVVPASFICFNCTSADNSVRKIGGPNVDTLFITVTGIYGLKTDAGGYVYGAGYSFPDGFVYSNLPPLISVKQYEDDNCNNELNGSTYSVYGTFIAIPPRLLLRKIFSDEPYYRSDAITVYEPVHTVPATGAIRTSCRDRAISASRSISVYLDPSMPYDTCQAPTNAECLRCAWPYQARRDSLACGCLVDNSRYQSPEQLGLYWQAYCNSYSDGSGSQYYIDRSRTNFDPAVGAVRAACSSPSTGRTVYVPAGRCPTGSSQQSLPDSLTGDTTQSAPGTVDDRPPSSDTGVSNRLDTIIGILRSGVGGAAGGGHDTLLGRKLDSFRTYIDTAGDVAYDSIRSRFGSVIDSLANDTFDIRPSIDSLMGIINTHSSRGDTTSYDGVTLDSMLNFCITIPIYDSTYCLRDTAAWPYIGPWFRWIRRMILVFWGFVCAGIFLSIAHGGRDD